MAAMAMVAVGLLVSAPASAETAETAEEPQPQQESAPETTDWQKREVETLEEGYAWGKHTTWPTQPRVIPSDSSNSDGAYGRFAGLLEVGLGLGAEFSANTPLMTARLTLHYFSTAGVYGMYSTSFSGTEADPVSATAPATTSTPNRLSAGVDLRPLFLPRFAMDYEQGPAFLDLAIDSFSLALGAFWQQVPGGDFGDVRGVEASVGGGVPLFTSASGFWIRFRGFGRWQTDVIEPVSVQWTGLVLLSFQQVLPI
jgi:hypothetical protein